MNEKIEVSFLTSIHHLVLSVPLLLMEKRMCIYYLEGEY
jgi:hypothetical protein